MVNSMCDCFPNDLMQLSFHMSTDNVLMIKGMPLFRLYYHLCLFYRRVAQMSMEIKSHWIRLRSARGHFDFKKTMTTFVVDNDDDCGCEIRR